MIEVIFDHLEYIFDNFRLTDDDLFIGEDMSPEEACEYVTEELSHFCVIGYKSMDSCYQRPPL